MDIYGIILSMDPMERYMYGVSGLVFLIPGVIPFLLAKVPDFVFDRLFFLSPFLIIYVPVCVFVIAIGVICGIISGIAFTFTGMNIILNLSG